MKYVVGIDLGTTHTALAYAPLPTNEEERAAAPVMLSIPQLASVTMLVPPTMMMSAEMLMNEAGLVPSIVALMSRATVAATMPMPVAAFMSLGSAGGSDTSAA